jgi:co-chaperonin GroES (HSP10)
MTIKLLTHHVLVKLDDPELKTQSGIIIATEEQAKKERKAVEYGTVIQVGPTAFIDYGRSPDILRPGDKVSFARYSGKEVVDTNKEQYILLNDQDVLCVLE